MGTWVARPIRLSMACIANLGWWIEYSMVCLILVCSYIGRSAFSWISTDFNLWSCQPSVLTTSSPGWIWTEKNSLSHWFAVLKSYLQQLSWKENLKYYHEKLGGKLAAFLIIELNSVFMNRKNFALACEIPKIFTIFADLRIPKIFTIFADLRMFKLMTSICAAKIVFLVISVAFVSFYFACFDYWWYSILRVHFTIISHP